MRALSDHDLNTYAKRTSVPYFRGVYMRNALPQRPWKNEKLHSFYPSVEPGFKIVETPSNVTYIPINVQRLDNITLSIVDQDGDTVDFRGEVITVRIHLKRIL